MGLSPQKLTGLIQETKRAAAALDKVGDYAKLMKKELNDLPGESKKSVNSISRAVGRIRKNIDELTNNINGKLNNMELYDEDIEEAANKLLLFHSSVDEVLNWAETQLQNHKKNSYWGKYWKGVYEVVSKRKEQQKGQQ
ncbi:MAG TPA: hypothetical protein VLB82_11995 [Thermodesulfobacteriota bacterium]|nr:hypothetical protein [Thermodesulfobacteriota bacterium]